LSCYSKTATSSDPGASITFGQTTAGRFALHIQVCRDPQGLPLSVKASNTGTAFAQSIAVASVTATGSALAVVAASWIQAATGGGNTSITHSLSYAQTTPVSVPENRLGVFWTRLFSNQSPSGSISTDAVTSAGADALSLILGY
jgi:hypothetical protein